ncbi:hypothetical protein P3W85_22835 [Cupriavidus basilensis]|uniref:Transmembrane protein n=1 Tax=Cupriavidus basilensis TaxID=68895 RepID=A0ABT6AT08_9BURK|nr:hypothetical protein [Cupriavidus basilensis]MDF3835762.1 hypothetical protein [Cupriavidus basilensis]
MKTISQYVGGWLLCAAAMAMLPACAILQPVEQGQKLIGAPQSTVRSTFGQPTGVYQLADGATRWLYSKQPMGYQVYAADFDASGNLSGFRQMLTNAEIYQAKVDSWTKRDVEEHFGKPREPVQFFALMKREVWSYRFRQDGMLPSLFHCYFDGDGVLRQVQITLDPLGGDSNRSK